jgi:zinc protease
LPAPALQALPNGLKVVVIERHTLPLLTLRLVVRAGAEADPAELPGAAQLVSALMTEGTTTKSARQIAEAIDSVGGMLESGADWDSSFVALSVPQAGDQVSLAFALLSEIAAHPAFAPAEIARQRQQTLSALEVERTDPAYIADMTLRRVLFFGTPYSHPDDGTIEAMQRIRAEDLRAFHARYYRPSNCFLAVVGDITTSEAFTRAEASFTAWQDQPVRPPISNSHSETLKAATGQPRIIAIDKPDAVQTEIRIGNLAAPRDSPDYYALNIANQILGGPASNRLFRALRSRQGLTYGASSNLLSYRGLGGWVAKTFTRTPETLKSVQIALEQMRNLRDHAINDSELETAKGYLVGHLALEFETSEGTASQTLDLMLHNLPLDYWNHYPENIRTLTAPDVWETTRRYLHPESNVIVLVGNISGFKKDLKKLGAVQMIPLSDLDFGAEDLARPKSGVGATRRVAPTGSEVNTRNP